MPLTLARAVELFLRDYDKRDTLKSYHQALDPLLEFFGEAQPVKKITPTEMKAFDQWFKKRPASTQSGKLAIATLRSRYKTVKTFFIWLVELEEIQTNPARVLKLPPLPERLDEDRAMPDEDFEKVKVAARSNPRNYALIMFMAESGCRAVDTSDLRLQHLDLQACSAVIIGKMDRQRRVWFGEGASQALREWLGLRVDEGHDYVFSSSHQPKGLDADDISQIIKRLCIKAKVKPRGSHSLRYRLMRILIDNGIDERTRMIIMGHKSLYVHYGYAPAETSRAQSAVLRVTAQPAVDKPKPTGDIPPNIIRFPTKIG